MRKKLSLLLSAVLAFSFTVNKQTDVYAASYQVNATTSVNVSTWEELRNALTDGTANKTIILKNSIDADAEATTPGRGYYEFGYYNDLGTWVKQVAPDLSITPTIVGNVVIDLNGYNLYLGNENNSNYYNAVNPTMFNLTTGTDLYIVNSKSDNGKVVFSTANKGSLIKASTKDASLHVYSDASHPVSISVAGGYQSSAGSSLFSIDHNASNSNRYAEIIELCGANISIDSYYGSVFDFSTSGSEVTPIYIGDGNISFVRQYSRLCYTYQVNTSAMNLFDSSIAFKSQDNTLFASSQADSDTLAFSNILSPDFYSSFNNYYTLTNVTVSDDLYTKKFNNQTITTKINSSLGTTVKPTLSSANAHYKINNLYKVTNVSGHTLTDISSTEATCTEDGHNIKKCSDCSLLVDEVTPAHGHSLALIDAKKATCHENGNNAYYHCSNCDKYFTDETASTETTEKEQLIPATGNHTYDNGKITKNATPTEEGEKTYTCTVCGETKVEKINKIPKYENTLTVKAKSVKVSAQKLKKKQVTIAAKKAMKITKACGTLSYKVSGNKKITVNKKTGKITIKKGLKKKTYTIKIKVTAAGNDTYLKGSKTVTVKIIVK